MSKAFQLATLVDADGNIDDRLDLAAISTSIADTAVDVFVYDTRKDSDGGAWRKRCQHTSWYNETLNTATRGSRREFPAVAVIVAESTQVTIYDGDDPDMPMWMVFNASGVNGASMIGRATEATTSVAMLNGHLVVGRNSFGLHEVFFIDDRGFFRENGNVNAYTKSIVDRNGTNSWGPNLAPVGELVNDRINDVAMTVLPNAPIDSATGLPVPTIAVATNGGVSVIKDDGSVVDLTSTNSGYNYWDEVQFTKDGGLLVNSNYINTTNNIFHVVDIPSSDVASATVNAQISALNGRYYHSDSSIPNTKTGGDFKPSFATMEAYEFAVGKQALNLIAEAPTTVSGITSDAMVNYITSSYNTGWMNGDIKLATLSDTDDTDVTGSELVTNGTFDSDVSGWTTGGTATIVYSSGKAICTRNNAGDNIVSSNFNITNGVKYILTYEHTDKTVNSSINVKHSNGTYSYQSGYIGNTDGIATITFTATFTGTAYISKGFEQNGSVTLDNVTCRLAEEDRSVNGNGLQVFGTVTKNPVATGADLVAYSGFSGSNYLVQPYNSDLDFGTGDICVMAWVNVSSYNATHIIFDKCDSSWPSPQGRLFFGINTSGYLYYYTDNISGNSSTSTSGTTIPTNTWVHACFVRNGDSHQLYQNGSLIYQVTQTARDTDATDAVLTVGNGTPGKTNQWPGSIALFRISATAPSAEQIKKIYEDEKVLFQENAQATLYGSSDAVTALAYDDDTQILSVGTSAGRSDFSGLRRVSNTTTAVTTAISSSNGMVVEQ